jgi:antitoxin ParD1/3/4
MDLSLPPELEKFVAAKVASGHYSSAIEVVREALRLLEEHDGAGATLGVAPGTQPAVPDRVDRYQAETVRERLQHRSEARRHHNA